MVCHAGFEGSTGSKEPLQDGMLSSLVVLSDPVLDLPCLPAASITYSSIDIV